MHKHQAWLEIGVLIALCLAMAVGLAILIPLVDITP